MEPHAADLLAVWQHSEAHSAWDIVILGYETALMESDKDWWSEGIEWNKKSTWNIAAARLFKWHILHNEKVELLIVTCHI